MADTIAVGVKVEGNASKELNKITRSVKQTSSAFDVFKGVLGAQAFVTGISALTRAAVGGFKSMINQAKDLEQIRTKFEVLTQSVAGGKQLLEELQEFAASTPFQLPGISEAAANLLAFGVAQEDIIPRLQVLGDIAAGTGQPLKEVATIFGQVRAAGKLTGERLNQLAERGINVGPAIAKGMGIAESQVREFVSKGKVSFDIFDKSLQSLTSESGIFFEGMVKQSKTLGGVLSTLGDNFALISSDIGAEFLPTIKEAALVLLQFLQDNRENFKQFANSVADNLPIVLTVLDSIVRAFTFVARVVNGVVNNLVDRFKAIKAAASGNFTEAMNILRNSSKTAAEDAGKAFDSFSEETLLGKLTVAVAESRMQINGMTEAMKKQSSQAKATAKANEEFLKANKETFEELQKLSQKFAEQDLENSIVAIEERAQAEQDALRQANERKLISQQEFNENLLASERRKNDALLKIDQKRQKRALADQKKFLSTASGLQRSKSKELQAIGKAAAITQVAIDTPPAISSSFRFGASIGGPPVGFIFAGIAAAAQAVQAAAIAGVPLQRGGEVPPGFPNDSFSARLTSGETVVPRGTTDDLKRFLDESAGSSALLASIDRKLSMLQLKTVVNVGNDTIVDAIRNAQDEGRVIA